MSDLNPISKDERFSMADEARLELWADAFQLWISSRRSPNTQRAYRCAWGQFVQFVQKQPWDVNKTDVSRWVRNLQEKGLAASTINSRVDSVRAFYYYAQEEYEIVTPEGERMALSTSNPAMARSLRLMVRRYEKAYYLNAEEARALLAAIPQDSSGGRRDYALILFYLATGRRNSEVRNLRWGDFAVKGDLVWYRWSGKGKKDQRYELPRPVWDAVKSYLEASSRLETIQDRDYVFTALSERARRLPAAKDWKFGTEPLSMREVGRILKRRARLAGLDASRIHVHSLRHTAAMLRLETGQSVNDISIFLAHSNLAITGVYLHEIEGKGDLGWSKVEALLGL